MKWVRGSLGWEALIIHFWVKLPSKSKTMSLLQRSEWWVLLELEDEFSPTRRELMGIWNQFGESSFLFSVISFFFSFISFSLFKTRVIRVAFIYMYSCRIYFEDNGWMIELLRDLNHNEGYFESLCERYEVRGWFPWTWGLKPLSSFPIPIKPSLFFSNPTTNFPIRPHQIWYQSRKS